MNLRNYKLSYLPKDIFAGIIIAAISIPISMGYTQIAGLPVIYGLYGSLLPILAFSLLSSSPQFIFGVDAAPAALIGGVLASLGIVSNSNDAITIVPVLTFYTACWLLLFSILKAGKIVNYISTPVMSGFISGICTTIILMQLPKLMGGASGTGELFELVHHLYETLFIINWPSLILGLVTLIIIRVGIKFIPKFPLPIIMMIFGAILEYYCHIHNFGINMLSKVDAGLPALRFPDLTAISFADGMGLSLTIALVITAETLLAENSYAQKNHYKLNDNREIFTFSVGNFLAAFTGCCPVNGSVSRTSMGEQFGGKTQVMSITAFLSMVCVLLFGTGFIQYLPVPVLTAIVISALMNVIEFDLAKRLYKIDKTEFFIFTGAFLGVLVLGTIYGVIIGVILSFVAVIIKAVDPPRAFLGIIPGKQDFHSLKSNKHAHQIEGVIVYRFTGSLFFANITAFQNDIENSITPDTKVIIIDAGGINSIDVTAADRLLIMYDNITSQGIKFYMTEHISAINHQLRTLGASRLVEQGFARINIETALRAAGYSHPYPLVGAKDISAIEVASEYALHEFDWAFGDDAANQMERHALDIIKNSKPFDKSGNLHRTLINTTNRWGGLNIFDESELLERLEVHLDELSKHLNNDEQNIEERLELRRKLIADKIKSENPNAFKSFENRIHKFDDTLAHENPEGFKRLQEHRKKMLKRLEKKNPELAKQIHEWYVNNDEM